MSSTRSTSPTGSEAQKGTREFTDLELDDHRNQPETLPIRNAHGSEGLDDIRTDRNLSRLHSRRISMDSRSDTDIRDDDVNDVDDHASVLEFTDDPLSALGYEPSSARRPRSFSRGARSQHRRSLSRKSAADSYHTVASSRVEGILLNARSSSDSLNSAARIGQPVMPRRSRRFTNGSNMSQHFSLEETGSRIGLDDQNEEDVCFPMIRNHERIRGIDFDELEEFSVSTRNIADYSTHNYYRPAVGHVPTSHRPLVPQSMVWTANEKYSNSRTHSNSSADSPESDQTKVSNPNEKTENVFQEMTFDDMDISVDAPDVTFRSARRNSFTMDRFSFFTSETDQTIHAPDIPSLVDDGETFQDLFKESNGTWWLDCLDPTDSEMRTISKAFGIHPLTAEDIRTKETREKVELFKSYYFVCFHTFEPDHESEEFLEPVNIYIVVFRDGILSFHFSPIQHTANVRRRIRQLREYVTVSSDWICYALIDDITDGFAPIIREIEIEADIIEDSVFVARESDFGHMIRRIGEARRKVMVLLRLLSGKADVIKMFAKRCNERWDNAPRGEIGLYLGDIQDHIVTMYQSLSVYEKIFSRSHANYLAQLQVESVNSNNRVTKVLGRVTLVGTVLVPLNLVTGLFGMNVTVPGQDGGTLSWFFGIIGFIVAVVVILSLIARSWLGEAESPEPEVSRPAPRDLLRSSAASIRSIGSRLKPSASRV